MTSQHLRRSRHQSRKAELLRAYDHICNAASFSLALEMAIGRVTDEQQRAALEALAGQVVDRLEDIKAAMERIRV